jgi:hypothetical protein
MSDSTIVMDDGRTTAPHSLPTALATDAFPAPHFDVEWVPSSVIDSEN